MIKKLFRACLILFVVPTLASAAWSYADGWPRSYRHADWSSTGIAPDPSVEREAIVQIYAARAGRWKGVFGVHTWIALKPAGSGRFERYEVVGWGTPVRRNKHPVDGRWYGNAPAIVRDIRGPLAARLIPQIRSSISRYPANRRGDYRVWPGPNSNTFVAWIAREFPALQIELPPTAVGKDYLGSGFEIARTPSATGWQFSIAGAFGAALARKEGFELHVLGATLGLDLEELAIKLPSIGTIGLLTGTGHAHSRTGQP
ncbi:MAG: DUF3750 domain-containing protein [Hyphomicrobiaceae bacterium]